MSTTNLPDSLVATLPGGYYTDEAIFGLEQQRVFESMWFCAVRSADLPTAGSFRTVQVGRESVLIVRNRTGDIRAFFNVCRHRGSRVCRAESGEVRRAFQCS
jgi:Rieske 2Fe-2S family protein